MKIQLTRSLIASALACLCLTSLPARAGLFDDDEARKAILDLRARVESLQKEVNTRLDDKADKSALLDQLNQFQQLRDEIAKLRGQIEVLANDLAMAQQRQKDFYVDLDTRLRKLEPQKVNVDGKEAVVEAAEQNAYAAAEGAFSQGDYKNAAAGLTDFLKRYPQSGYAANAQYLLGNAFWIQRDFKNALASYQIVIRNYPDSAKAPDALLNISSCYIELKDKPGAKRALEMLVTKYPDSAVASSAKERLKALK